jgi:hypothetical protein
MGAATPIEIPILDEQGITPVVRRTRKPATPAVAANNNSAGTKWPLKRSPSHIALVIESLADAKPEPPLG